MNAQVDVLVFAGDAPTTYIIPAGKCGYLHTIFGKVSVRVKEALQPIDDDSDFMPIYTTYQSLSKADGGQPPAVHVDTRLRHDANRVEMDTTAVGIDAMELSGGDALELDGHPDVAAVLIIEPMVVPIPDNTLMKANSPMLCGEVCSYDCGSDGDVPASGIKGAGGIHNAKSDTRTTKGAHTTRDSSSPPEVAATNPSESYPDASRLESAGFVAAGGRQLGPLLEDILFVMDATDWDKMDVTQKFATFVEAHAAQRKALIQNM